MPVSDNDEHRKNAAEVEDMAASPVGKRATNHKRATKTKRQKGPLTGLIGGGEPDFADSESIDAFIRAERRTWSS